MTNKKQSAQINNPFLSHADKQTFYLFPALSQRLNVITRLFTGKSRLLLIFGEKGSGKTLLMKQLMAYDEKNWKVCRINAHDPTDIPNDKRLQGMMEHRAYMHTKNEFPVVMMDEAHTLTSAELAFLLRLTGLKGYQRQLDKLVLFCESSIQSRLSELSDMIPETGVVEKVFMPRMTVAEMHAYVNKRMTSAGYLGTTFFTSSDMAHIHEESDGFPGRINESAARIFSRKNREGTGLKSFFKQFF